jgi:hypothetical protein
MSLVNLLDGSLSHITARGKENNGKNIYIATPPTSTLTHTLEHDCDCLLFYTSVSS